MASSSSWNLQHLLLFSCLLCLRLHGETEAVRSEHSPLPGMYIHPLSVCPASEGSEMPYSCPRLTSIPFLLLKDLAPEVHTSTCTASPTPNTTLVLDPCSHHRHCPLSLLPITAQLSRESIRVSNLLHLTLCFQFFPVWLVISSFSYSCQHQPLS